MYNSPKSRYYFWLDKITEEFLSYYKDVWNASKCNLRKVYGKFYSEK